MKPTPEEPEEDRPTLLVIGKLGPIESALRTALVQRGMHVEVATKDEAVMTAFAAAPDLVLLAGDAAKGEGSQVIELLAKNPATAVLPVILLADDPSLQGRLQAFRHGAVAVVPRSASVDEMARRITDLAGEVHDRPGHSKGELGEASLDELMELLSKEVRSGILSVRTGDGPGDANQARVVLRAGKPVQQAIEQFVQRLRPLVRQTEAPLSYTFEESTVARLDMLDGATEAEPTSGDALQGRRVLVVHDNPAQADVLAQELRARSATVVVSDGAGSGLGRARDLDPDVVVVDAGGIDTWAYQIMAQLRQDARLRWASVLLVDWNELWAEGAPTPDMDRLAAAIEPLIQPDQALVDRAQGDKVFDTRLEILGPGRTLRALAETGKTLHVTVRHPRATVQVDLAEGLIAGASWQSTSKPSKEEEGPAALAALLSIGSGRVRVEPREVPSKANVMTPAPDALMAAAAEASPLAPSIPPGDGGPPPASPEDSVWEAHSTDFDVDIDDEPTRVADDLLSPATGPAAPAAPEDPAPPAGAAAVPTELVQELRTLVQELRATRQSSSGQVEAPAPPVPPRPAPPRGGAPPAGAAAMPPPPPAATAPTAQASAPTAPKALPVEASEKRGGNLGKIVLAIAVVAGIALGGAAAFFLGGEEGEGSGQDGLAMRSGAPPAQTAPDPPAAPQASTPASEQAAAPTTPEPEAEDETASEDEAADDAEEEQASDGTEDEEEAAKADDADEAKEDEAEEDEAEEETAEDEGADEAADTADDEDDEVDEDEDEDEAVAAPSKAKQRQQVVNRLIVRANGLRRARRYSQAAALYKRALRFQPRNPRALAGLTRTYMAMGNKQGAVQSARRLVKVRPGVAANYVLLGDTLKAAGDKAGARRAWRTALRIAPGYKPARYRLQGK